MNRILTAPLLLLLAPLWMCAQTPRGAIEKETRRLEALAANPELKPAVVAAMADSLQVHRNHLFLLRRQTGNSFADIYVSELRARGMDDASVLRSLRALLGTVERQVRADNTASAGIGAKPVFLVGSAADHSSRGQVFSLVPEFGFESKRFAAVVGVPYYWTSNTTLSAQGLGDVYLSGLLRAQTAGMDFGTALTLGAPTGDRNKGLGAGKVSIDATETVSRRVGIARPWLSAGSANSVFDNVGYVRPYTTDGQVVHFAGGVDFALRHKLAAGIAGFGLEPFGSQIVYSQVVNTGTPGNAVSQPPPQSGGGMMPGGGAGMGKGGGMTMPPDSSMPFYTAAQRTVVSASELRDYGASVWISVPLYSGVSFDTGVARSVPFRLTTVHVGIGIDAARLLFPRKWF